MSWKRSPIHPEGQQMPCRFELNGDSRARSCTCMEHCTFHDEGGRLFRDHR